jgi:hypothetical protein
MDQQGAAAIGVDLADETRFDLVGMVRAGLNGGSAMFTALGATGLVNGGHIRVALVDALEPGDPNGITDSGIAVLGERSVRENAWDTDYSSVAFDLVRRTAAIPDYYDSGDEHVTEELAGVVCRRYVVTTTGDEEGDVQEELHLIVGVGSANPWISRAVANAVADTVGYLWMGQTVLLAGTDSNYVEPAQDAA